MFNLKLNFLKYSYNALLCDSNVKLKNLNGNNRVSIGVNDYGDYEFYKFQVPFDYTEITKVYLKLMEMCSFSKKFNDEIISIHKTSGVN